MINEAFLIWIALRVSENLLHTGFFGSFELKHIETIFDFVQRLEWNGME